MSIEQCVIFRKSSSVHFVADVSFVADTAGEVKKWGETLQKRTFSPLSGEYKPLFVFEQHRTSLQKTTSPAVSATSDTSDTNIASSQHQGTQVLSLARYVYVILTH